MNYNRWKVVIFMKLNYTTLFLLLFVASIAGGMAFIETYEYSMLVGLGLGLVFLFCAATALRKDVSEYR